jgi:hypothetical protein
MRKPILFSLLSLLTLSLTAQTDTLKVMFNNLMNFPKANVIPNRQDTLRKTLRYVNPDVFMACELNTSAGANTVLNSSLNVFGTTSYQKATFVYNTSVPGDSLQQMIYWQGGKLALKSQSIITTDQRDVNKYVMYYKDPNLAIHHDTTWIDFYITHLKAGNTAADATKRNNEATSIMTHVNAQPSTRNNILAADFNVYTSAEAAYGTLLSGTNRFYDPISRPGAWNNTGSFADIHTQSTRTVSFNGGATGGLDDRFDQILVSGNVVSGANRVRYLPGSYKALGQDALHFNLSLIAAPVNTSAPDSVIKAMYYMTDHLPVIMRLVVTLPTPLPAEVLSFDLRSRGRSIEVTGTVEHASDRERVAIVRSVDGEHWQEIALVPAKGPGQQTYQVADHPQEEGTYFYQLRILDEAGGEERSQVREAAYRPSQFTFAFVNPVAGEVCEVMLDADAQGEVTLVSYTGQLLQTVRVVDGRAMLAVGHLPAGLYVVTYHDLVNGWGASKRMMKQ